MTTAFRTLTMALGLLLPALGAGTARAQDAGLLASWRDGEIRQTYRAADDATDVYFALVPSCTAGSPTVTFGATLPGRTLQQAPAGFELRAATGMRIDQRLVRTATWTFLVNPGSRRPATLDLSSRVQVANPGHVLGPAIPIDVLYARMTGGEFQTIAGSRSLTLNLFGAECELTEGQLAALRRFARLMRLEPPPQVEPLPDLASTDAAVQATAARAAAPQPAVPPSGALSTVVRPRTNAGVWVQFEGARWASAGRAVPMTAAFEPVGRLGSVPVFRTREGGADLIYLPTRDGVLAPYRRAG